MIILFKLTAFFKITLAIPTTTIDQFFYEELAPNTFIGDLKDLKMAYLDDNHNKNNTSDNSRNITFRIIQQSCSSKYPEKVDADFFRIDERTGSLYSNRVIDREMICPKTDLCFIFLRIMAIVAGSVQNVQLLNVNVKIMDVNDNHPQFPHSTFVYNISESAEPNQANIEIPSARDLDGSEFNIKKFYIKPNDGVFELYAEEVNGEFNLKLILRSFLDRESIKQYNFTIYAEDKGKPPKNGSMKVVINVLDANDNTPVFHKDIYDQTVREDAKIRTVLLKVHASDEDEGKNGEVIYGFNEHTSKEFENLFKIDERTGEIILMNELDYETTKEHRLTVVAKDLGPDALPVHARVTIKVEDVNDNAPRIKLHAIDAPFGNFKEKDEKNGKHITKQHQKTKNDVMEKSNGRTSVLVNQFNNSHFMVAENRSQKQLVAHVSVSDDDSGDNAKISCHLKEESEHTDKFKLNRFDNRFVIVKPEDVIFDREYKNYYTLIIICNDHGIPSLTSALEQVITVSDENDNSPSFAENQQILTVYENKPIGTVIDKIKADDMDVGENGAIKFSLGGRNEVLELLEIDPSSGMVRTKNMIDRETTAELEVIIFAADFGIPPRTSSTTITIKVLDEDDEGPMFSENKYTFDIEEGQSSGIYIGHLSATDRDQPPNNAFHYALENNEFTHVFNLNSSSGILTTNEKLDREKYSSYHLVVLAKSGSYNDIFKPRFISKTNVIINVIDVNDNRPQYVYPLNNDTIHISNLSPLGNIILQLKALDFDSGRNAEMSFFIISGNEDGLFRIDQTTNNLIVARSLEDIKHEEVLLTLQVKDHGDPPLSNYEDIKIIISDKILFNNQLINSGSVFGFNTAAELLADETVAIALAVLLAVILVLISIFTLVIWLFGVGRKRRLESLNGHQGKDIKCKNKSSNSEETHQAVVTSLSANGRTETTVARSSSAEKELKMDLTDVKNEAKMTSKHQPVVMFVKDQHNLPNNHEKYNESKDESKTSSKKAHHHLLETNAADKKFKNHLVNTDWYMIPGVDEQDSTRSKPDVQQNQVNDLIEFNNGFSNFTLQKQYLSNEKFIPSKYLPQNRNFEQWLDDI